MQMWQGRAQSRCRCGSDIPSPGADVAAIFPSAHARRAHIVSLVVSAIQYVFAPDVQFEELDFSRQVRVQTGVPLWYYGARGRKRVLCSMREYGPLGD